MKKILYLVLGVVIIIAGVTIWKATTAPPVEHQQPAMTEQVSDNVTMIVDFPVQEDLIISQVYQPDQTVFDLMQASTLDMEYEEYDFGVLITSLGGVVGGTGDNYWIYYVNNETAQVGISDYILNPGDVITWRFESDYGVEE